MKIRLILEQLQKLDPDEELFIVNTEEGWDGYFEIDSITDRCHIECGEFKHFSK